MPPEVAELAGRLFDLARRGSSWLLDYVDAGAPIDLANGSGDTLVMLAAYHGHDGLVRGLLARGADPDRPNLRGQTPLAGAVFKGERAVAEALLAGGADPDAGVPTAREAAAMFGSELAALLPPRAP
ncbi:ankyrin repeat domain-containing protein [Phycicoccus endophyticus]|uniref:Ankyrin repeat domain-containing protein n=1 Tax=Phycicoccus endophyticus TaxID=1690220 RepID=A0A7G9R5L5_9MICO|nr:ankyrin repeat domain-containing protein [Phycicoccus endophyticus]NHI19825.1 ankyrin repeat domain-containing protein [Phycicoccus endophyticus]QNN50890.1 ankyrin repeat domain-containing protein [Phycicoccus endophyticus]